MNILSLFDGMSCGQQALERAGVEVTNYFASEIDKYAIKITQKNYPNTVQLGDIEQWREWEIDWASIDLILAGSPCQGFSFAGKQLAFDDPRSKLFFTFVDILNHAKSKGRVHFLLENVRMKKEYMDVISQHVNIEPILINSALFSAQSRKRLYWFNWNAPTPTEDKGYVLQDVLEDGIADRAKSYCITARIDGTTLKSYVEKHRGQVVFSKEGLAHVGNAVDIKGHEAIKRVYAPEGKSPALTTMGGGHREPKVVCGAWRGRYNKDGSTSQRLELRSDSKTNTVTSVQKDNVVVAGGQNEPIFLAKNKRVKGVTENYRGYRPHQGDFSKSGLSECGRILKKEAAKTDTLTASHTPKISINNDIKNLTYRKLTPVECERLQTIRDNYTEGVSKTQRYKMIGNGWTVDVIAYLLGFLK